MKKLSVVVAIAMAALFTPINAEVTATATPAHHSHKKGITHKKHHKTHHKPGEHHKNPAHHNTTATHKAAPVANKGWFGNNAGAHRMGDKSVGTTTTGKTIYEGPEGGHYTLSSTGTKEYIQTPVK